MRERFERRRHYVEDRQVVGAENLCATSNAVCGRLRMRSSISASR